MSWNALSYSFQFWKGNRSMHEANNFNTKINITKKNPTHFFELWCYFLHYLSSNGAKQDSQCCEFISMHISHWTARLPQRSTEFFCLATGPHSETMFIANTITIYIAFFGEIYCHGNSSCYDVFPNFYILGQIRSVRTLNKNYMLKIFFV